MPRASIILARQHWKDDLHGLLVCSDSQYALGVVERWGSKDPEVNRLICRLGLNYEIDKIWFRTRWVKGHQPPDASTAAWLNNQVDALAARGRMNGHPGTHPNSNAAPPHRKLGA